MNTCFTDVSVQREAHTSSPLIWLNDANVLVLHIDDLRATLKTVKDIHPLTILAMVVLPEHLHAIWRLSPDDADYPLR